MSSSAGSNSGASEATLTGMPSLPDGRHGQASTERGFMLVALLRLADDRLALAGLGIVAAIVIIAAMAPYLMPHDPLKVALDQRLAPMSRAYPLGTDQLGRCLLSRLIYGARVSLSTSGLALAAILLFSIPVGTAAGYLGGWVDNLLMRIVDVLLAFPSLILALVIAGMLGPSLTNVMLAVASVWWVSYARVIRGIVLSVKEKEYVMAARACGTSEFGIITRHIFPNVMSTLIVLATLDMGKIILAISSLSFLGLGAQPPTPEWGSMLNDGRSFMQVAPQLMICPGLAIMIVVLAFNLLGDGLRDAFDPRGKVS